MENASQIIPPQHTGRATDFTHEKEFDNIQAAHKGFLASAERLLRVNNWHDYAGLGSSIFSLCNNQGEDVDGFAAEGLYFNVDMPAPGPDAGNGFEWVMIEKLITEGDEHSAEEYVAMTVRPAANPNNTDMQIAHFYTDESTSTFIVRRDGRVLSAGAHGRNESPNNTGVDLHDKIRNTAIALIARIGLSGMQWQKLVNGLIDHKE